MRFARIAFLATLLLPAIGLAQIPSCPECVLGIFDDPALTASWGSIAILEPKEVYIGMKSSGSLQDFAGVEFSIAGLDQSSVVLMGAVPVGARPLVFGTIPSPPDTTANSDQEGGVVAVWGRNCRHPNEVLFKLVLFTGEQISNHVLQVKRSYPTSNPMWHAPALVRCDEPFFTATTISGGCYILNPDQASDCVDPNRVAVTPTNWSAVKSLYR